MNGAKLLDNMKRSMKKGLFQGQYLKHFETLYYAWHRYCTVNQLINQLLTNSPLQEDFLGKTIFYKWLCNETNKRTHKTKLTKGNAR